MNREQENSVISTELPDSVATTRYLAQKMIQESGDFSPTTETGGIRNDKIYKNLDGFMIGRASFGNPWCFLPGNYIPTLDEILTTMMEHGDLLWQVK